MTLPITGLVLAGGRGSRMGGVDKGLQPFQGKPLILHALQRLQAQVGTVAISANRNLSIYEGFHAPVWPDSLPDYPGPLAGVLSGFEHCQTPWLLVVPCDVPRFPEDLAQRLLDAAQDGQDGREAEIALPMTDRSQPAFCLIAAALHESLARYLDSGNRKIEDWTKQHRHVLVPFDRPGDDPLAFANLNTLEELAWLEQQPMTKA